MSAPHKAPAPPVGLTLHELNRMIPVKEGAEIIDIHEDTFRKHYAHLIVKIGPRLDRVRIGDVYAIGRPKD